MYLTRKPLFFFAPARLKYVELFLITVFVFSTEHLTSLAWSWPSSKVLMVWCAGAGLLSVALSKHAHEKETVASLRACAGVFSPAVDHPSSVVTGSSLPHSP